MSDTFHQLTFAITVNDPEKWTSRQHEFFENSEDVIASMWGFMAKAGQAYIDANPELFRSETIV